MNLIVDKKPVKEAGFLCFYGFYANKPNYEPICSIGSHTIEYSFFYNSSLSLWVLFE